MRERSQTDFLKLITLIRMVWLASLISDSTVLILLDQIHNASKGAKADDTSSLKWTALTYVPVNPKTDTLQPPINPPALKTKRTIYQRCYAIQSFQLGSSRRKAAHTLIAQGLWSLWCEPLVANEKQVHKRFRRRCREVPRGRFPWFPL